MCITNKNGTITRQPNYENAKCQQSLYGGSICLDESLCSKAWGKKHRKNCKCSPCHWEGPQSLLKEQHPCFHCDDDDDDDRLAFLQVQFAKLRNTHNVILIKAIISDFNDMTDMEKSKMLPNFEEC